MFVNSSDNSRTDGVKVKMRLLESAYAAGNHDLAMSLAESIKDTLSLDRQLAPEAAKPHSGAKHFIPVAQLAGAWAKWASGWSFCKPLVLFETVGVARKREPVEAVVAFLDEQTTDLPREVRVARVDPQTGTLAEVTSQIHSHVRQGDTHICRVVFLADVAMHEQAAYLLFYGNENAELPCYSTDLRVTGEGYGLNIENHHFTAQLSQQMGQLERLTYKREHGLELFAGGKGHGEPPGIDWSHDYVDAGQFQKLRMRNWERCPHFEVVRGPLCVKVRRWGFPHSPIHPLFTPSRMHMDQTYVFYAGAPWFVKEARFDMVQDFNIEAMRDDEWVFSGYSFTKQVWIDRHGKLREGAVPPAEADDLWGIGFYHEKSRDAFIAIWLDHSAKGLDGVKHNASPSLHYHGHGQLWARYPLRHTKLNAGSSIQLRNAYLTAPYPNQAAPAKLETLRHQMLNPLEILGGDLPKVAGAKATGALARWGETKQSALLKPAIWKALNEVRDEQLYKAQASIVDLGYVYDVRVRNGAAHVLVTMPHRGRPVHEFLVTQGGGRVDDGIRERLLRIKGIEDVVVDFTWEPAWSVARINNTGRKAMGLD